MKIDSFPHLLVDVFWVVAKFEEEAEKSDEDVKVEEDDEAENHVQDSQPQGSWAQIFSSAQARWPVVISVLFLNKICWAPFCHESKQLHMYHAVPC